MSIPIANPVISEAAKDAVADVLDSGMIADGDEVREFEDEFADAIGVDHAVATANGTVALHAVLEAAGIGDGDVVLTSPFSFVASSNAAVHAGAEPVFADIRTDTFNLDPGACREILERRSVDVILPVHLYGLPAEMDRFRDLAAEFDCLLVEDAAQAHGATYRGEQAGSLGDAATFSFYATKNVTTGEGGMITTDDAELAGRARRVINHGRTGPNEHAFVGYNYRLTNIQAAIGRDQLRRLPDWIERRQQNAAALSDGLSSLDGVMPPAVPGDRDHAYHQYTVRVESRDEVTPTLDDHEVGYGIYYPTAIPDQPAYDDVNCPSAARRAASEVLSLPVHPEIDREDIETIISAVEDAVGVET